MTDDARKTIGNALRTLRENRKLKQAEVAKQARVSIGTLQMIEKGEGREVRISNIRKVTAIFETSIEQLLQVPVPDPRLENLRNEDFRIARLYHHADSDVRKWNRLLLEGGETGRWFLLLEKLANLPDWGLATVEGVIENLPKTMPDAPVELIEAPTPPSVVIAHNKPKKKKKK